MSENNQKNQQRKSNRATYIVVIIFMAIVIVVAMQFLAPTIGNVYPTLDSACYSMSQNDFEEITESIHGLIAGGDPDTTTLTHILLTDGPTACLVNYYGSFSAVTGGGGDFCDNHTRGMYRLLRATHTSAQNNGNLIARYYLWLAELRWNIHD
jgi:hypothetical protein